MKVIKRLLLISAVLPLISSAQLRTANIFSDHIVLQRNKPVPVWGWAAAGEKVMISLNGQTATARAAGNGAWKAVLPAMQAGGPFTLLVTGKKETISIQDVLIGEVWICSGQSNMEFTVSNVNNAQKEIAAADNPQIRQIKIGDTLSLTELDDISPNNKWEAATPATVGNFTAVGYFFARDLYQKLQVPVGLINDNWGGSQVEGWISKGAMLQSTALHNYAINMPTTWEGANASLEKRMAIALSNNPTHTFSSPTANDIQKEGYSYDNWPSMSAPGQWDWAGIWAYRGEGFMEHTVAIQPADVNKASVINLGTNDSKYVVFINGRQVAEGQQKNIVIQLPAGAWKGGENQLVIKQGAQINPVWAGMGIHGNAEQLFVQFDTKKISLAGNNWKMMPSMSEPYTFAKLSNNIGTTIYNAMIHPVVPYAMQGVLWYQGEANTGRAYQYRTTFPLLINDWRTQWKDTFPFLFVQLSSFGGNQSSNEGSDWAELREAQTGTLSLPATGMAVTTDIGNASDIHPKNKQDVGKRLAAVALNNVYKIDTPFSGPVYQSVKFDSSKAIISFQYAANGLMVKDKYGYLKGFEIAGSDKKFYYAVAVIAGSQVIVSSNNVTQPVAVRYAWTNAPEEANLYNKEGFPASSFHTDDWPGITVHATFE